MKIESKGYRITGLPYDGWIGITSDDSLNSGVRIDIELNKPASGVLRYSRSDVIVLRAALAEAERLAEQMEDET